MKAQARVVRSFDLRRQPPGVVIRDRIVSMFVLLRYVLRTTTGEHSDRGSSFDFGTEFLKDIFGLCDCAKKNRI
jgi:hypothetical protein